MNYLNVNAYSNQPRSRRKKLLIVCYIRMRKIKHLAIIHYRVLIGCYIRMRKIRLWAIMHNCIPYFSNCGKLVFSSASIVLEFFLVNSNIQYLRIDLNLIMDIVLRKMGRPWSDSQKVCFGSQLPLNIPRRSKAQKMDKILVL